MRVVCKFYAEETKFSTDILVLMSTYIYKLFYIPIILFDAKYVCTDYMIDVNIMVALSLQATI